MLQRAEEEKRLIADKKGLYIYIYINDFTWLWVHILRQICSVDQSLKNLHSLWVKTEVFKLPKNQSKYILPAKTGKVSSYVTSPWPELHP